MSWGMRRGEFWNSGVEERGEYYQAHLYQLEDRNFIAWMQGIYVMKAVNPKKGSKMIEYDKEPIRITPMTEEEKLEKAERDMEEMARKITEAFESGQNKQKYITGERLGQ